MDFENFDKNKIELNGFIEKGKQYDIEVKVPEDKRNVVFGIVKDEYGDPICDAVVKLIEIEKTDGTKITTSSPLSIVKFTFSIAFILTSPIWYILHKFLTSINAIKSLNSINIIITYFLFKINMYDIIY